MGSATATGPGGGYGWIGPSGRQLGTVVDPIVLQPSHGTISVTKVLQIPWPFEEEGLLEKGRKCPSRRAQQQPERDRGYSGKESKLCADLSIVDTERQSSARSEPVTVSRTVCLTVPLETFFFH